MDNKICMSILPYRFHYCKKGDIFSIIFPCTHKLFLKTLHLFFCEDQKPLAQDLFTQECANQIVLKCYKKSYMADFTFYGFVII